MSSKKNKSDFYKFGIYSFVFTVLIFQSIKSVDSPYYTTIFNSSSIYNEETINPLNVATEEKQDTSTGSISIDKPTEEKEQKTIQTTKKPVFTFQYTPNDLDVSNYTKRIIKNVLSSSYFTDKIRPLSININGEIDDPRGQTASRKIILSYKIKESQELIKVLVHELGHVIDIYFFQKSDNGDVSDDFYNISWESAQVKQKNAKIDDFVSGYAMSNKYEDFAESLAFYIFHNEEFKTRAKKNDKLKNKYDFFRNKLFGDDSFIDSSFEEEAIKSYNWDTTKIKIDLQKFLYYIQ